MTILRVALIVALASGCSFAPVNEPSDDELREVFGRHHGTLDELRLHFEEDEVRQLFVVTAAGPAGAAVRTNAWECRVWPPSAGVSTAKG